MSIDEILEELKTTTTGTERHFELLADLERLKNEQDLDILDQVNRS